MKKLKNKKTADKKTELLRVLDENGNLTSKTEKRSIVHEQGLFHQEVAFIPVNIIGGDFTSKTKQRQRIIS